MNYRDRIRELRRVPAHTLRANPKNWRLHPPQQQQALQAILQEVGFADALLVRELSDGCLEIIDGHLRAEIMPEAMVPVLVLDLNDAEAAKVLATHDAITGLAETDLAQLNRLLEECDFSNPAFAPMFEQLNLAEDPPSPPESACAKPAEQACEESYQVVVTCYDESAQQALYERLRGEGFACRLLML